MAPRLLLGLVLLAASPSRAQDGDVKVPDAARRFVAAGTKAIACELADLNRDGREDAILVLQDVKPPEDPSFDERPRPLLILVRRADGTFREAARNDAIVRCASCGGMMGDPFQGVSVGPGTFTVSNGGGTGWRWFYEYRFDYSRRDGTWQLVRVKELEGYPSGPDAAEEVVSTPPKDFGKIGIAEFDPEHWKGVGPK